MSSDDAKNALAALAPIDGMIQAVRGSLSSPASLIGDATWRGSAADSWRSDWEARRKQIEAFLADAEHECGRLRSKLQAQIAQEAKKSQ